MGALVSPEGNSRIRVGKGALHWLTGEGQDSSPHSVAGWPRKYRDQVRWLSVIEEELGSMSSFEGVPRLKNLMSTTASKAHNIKKDSYDIHIKLAKRTYLVTGPKEMTTL